MPLFFSSAGCLTELKRAGILPFDPAHDICSVKVFLFGMHFDDECSRVELVVRVLIANALPDSVCASFHQPARILSQMCAECVTVYF